MIALLLLLSLNGLPPQTTQPALNQVELMKQFIGNWKCEVGRDSTAYWDFKSFGTGLKCSIKYITKDKIFNEVESLYGYDKKSGKFIAPLLVKGKDLEIFAIWFLSDRKYEIIFYSDISNPEKASIKNIGEFRSADIITVTKIINEKPVSALTFTRVQK